MPEVPEIKVRTRVSINSMNSSMILKSISEDSLICALETTPEYVITPGQEHIAFISSDRLGYVDLELKVISSRFDNQLIQLKPSCDLSVRRIEALKASLRKEQHIDICDKENVEHSERYTGFSEFNFIPTTFPELDYDQLDLSANFLGKIFQAPIFVTGMTGGVKRGGSINAKIAKACQKKSIPMGVGSQRIALEHPEYSDIFDVKKYAPNLFLIGNLGIAQLLSNDGLDLCKKAIEMIDADALAIHANVLQEMIQIEGDKNFKGVLNRIESLCSSVKIPILVKEVGSGIDIKSARQLLECGVTSIDVGGSGGTSWGFIEGLRTDNLQTRNLSGVFRDWGIPTAFNIKALTENGLDIQVSATGGIRDGLSAAKALALGASIAGIGLPIFRAALSDDETAVDRALEEIIEGIKITMMLTGSKTPDELKSKLVTGKPYSSLM